MKVVITDRDNMDYLMEAIEKQIRRALNLAEDDYYIGSNKAVILEIVEDV